MNSKKSSALQNHYIRTMYMQLVVSSTQEVSWRNRTDVSRLFGIHICFHYHSLAENVLQRK